MMALPPIIRPFEHRFEPGCDFGLNYGDGNTLIAHRGKLTERGQLATTNAAAHGIGARVTRYGCRLKHALKPSRY